MLPSFDGYKPLNSSWLFSLYSTTNSYKEVYNIQPLVYFTKSWNVHFVQAKNSKLLIKEALLKELEEGESALNSIKDLQHMKGSAGMIYT